MTSDTLPSSSSSQPPAGGNASQLPVDPILLGPEDFADTDSDHSDEEVEEPPQAPTPTPSAQESEPVSDTSATPQPGRQRTSRGGTKRKRGEIDIERLMERSQKDWAERDDKRLKAQADSQIEIARIQAESHERIMEAQRQMEKENQENQSALERDREERQTRTIQTILSSMVDIVNAKNNT